MAYTSKKVIRDIIDDLKVEYRNPLALPKYVAAGLLSRTPERLVPFVEQQLRYWTNIQPRDILANQIDHGYTPDVNPNHQQPTHRPRLRGRRPTQEPTNFVEPLRLNYDMMEMETQGPTIINGVPTDNPGKVITTYTDPHDKFSHHKKVPYNLSSNIERTLQPLVYWEEFDHALNFNCTGGVQQIHTIDHPQLLQARVKQHYWKLNRDVCGF